MNGWRTAPGLLAFAALVSATGVLVLTPAAPSTAAKCPPGESKDSFTGVCVPTSPTNVIQETVGVPGGSPEIDGVPCTGHNSYECIGLAEESQATGPTPTPHATIEHDP